MTSSFRLNAWMMNVLLMSIQAMFVRTVETGRKLSTSYLLLLPFLVLQAKYRLFRWCQREGHCLQKYVAFLTRYSCTCNSGWEAVPGNQACLPPPKVVKTVLFFRRIQIPEADSFDSSLLSACIYSAMSKRWMQKHSAPCERVCRQRLLCFFFLWFCFSCSVSMDLWCAFLAHYILFSRHKRKAIWHSFHAGDGSYQCLCGGPGWKVDAGSSTCIGAREWYNSLNASAPGIIVCISRNIDPRKMC